MQTRLEQQKMKRDVLWVFLVGSRKCHIGAEGIGELETDDWNAGTLWIYMKNTCHLM
jgi:hypothetical protein